MEHDTPNTEPGALPAPAPDGLRDSMEAAGDWLEARLTEAEREAAAMPADRLAALLRETSDYHHHLAESADEDSAQACRVQSAAIWRAAGELDRLRGEVSDLRAWLRRAVYVLNTAAAARGVDPESGSLRYISGECEICAADGMALDRAMEGGDR